MKGAPIGGAGVALLTLLLSVSPLRAATLHVPGEYGTIQAGVDAAAVGDTVIVAPGTYSDFETRTLQASGSFTVSAIVFMKQGVSLIGAGGPNVTVLDLAGQGDGDFVHCIIVWVQGGGDMLVRGFRIMGAPTGHTGVLAVQSGPLELRDCVLDSFDGSVGGRAGGLEATGTGPVSLYGCLFTQCLGSPPEAGAVLAHDTSILAEDCIFERGTGGVLYDGTSSFGPSAVFRRCRFTDNTGGGGLNVNGPEVNVEDCWFEANSAGGGAGLTVRNALDLLVARNVIVGNTAGAQAGAWISRSYGMVVGNTFHGNVDQLDLRGANLYVSSPDGVGFIAIENNIFSGARGSHAVHVPQAIVSSSCNVFWDNPLGDVNGSYPWDPTDTVQDPQFCDPDGGDFTVSGTSPCLPAFSGACGVIGALGQGCGSVSVEAETWSKIKGAYR